MTADLVEKLQRNARFYQREAEALAEKPERRDNRFLGAKEAQTIADLLCEAADALLPTAEDVKGILK